MTWSRFRIACPDGFLSCASRCERVRWQLALQQLGDPRQCSQRFGHVPRQWNRMGEAAEFLLPDATPESGYGNFHRHESNGGGLKRVRSRGEIDNPVRQLFGSFASLDMRSSGRTVAAAASTIAILIESLPAWWRSAPTVTVWSRFPTRRQVRNLRQSFPCCARCARGLRFPGEPNPLAMVYG